MKDCYMYYKQDCTCEEKDHCYDKNGVCPYAIVKEKCKDCDKDILECYECKK